VMQNIYRVERGRMKRRLGGGEVSFYLIDTISLFNPVGVVWGFCMGFSSSARSYIVSMVSKQVERGPIDRCLMNASWGCSLDQLGAVTHPRLLSLEPTGVGL
jgi:hypothetical protein